MGPGGGVDCLGLTFNQRRLLKVDKSGSILQWRQSRGAGGNPPPHFSTPKKGEQRWPNTKYCDCGEVRDQESGRI